ncbi:IS3 family transposase [Embleya sp. NPDC059259]|uniref:IS3 family transposase n=1 Tax=unclassified Embleya TaxID=2699296 RepID=UPI00368DAC01
MARPNPYTPEFREEAVQLALKSAPRSIAQTARDLDVHPETLRAWVREHQRRHEKAEGPLAVDERARLKELERRNRELEMENSFLKKAAGVLREGSPVGSKYEFIETMRLDTVEYAYPVAFMCDRLGVSKSGYYDWRHRPESATTGRREELKRLVTKAFEMSDGTYGYRRIHAQLLRWGVAAGSELVRRILRDLGLLPCQPRPKRRSLTRAASAPAPDLVGRDFTAAAPGEKLVGDITYIPTAEGWLYLATAIDCCTKEVVGYAMDDHYQTPLISRAIRNAARNRTLAEGAIFHSDRGSNYMSAEYVQVLSGLGLRRSVGRTGICFDNAMAESFFASLKNERVSRTKYATREEARRDIVRYIEFWYNRKRLHSAVGYRPPSEVHTEFEELRLAA